jgi:hypothetical protein
MTSSKGMLFSAMYPLHPEDGDSKFPRNISTYLAKCTMLTNQIGVVVIL